MRFNKDAIIYCMVQGIGALLILWLCLHLVGCRTIQQQTAVHNRDSVRIEVRLDSIYVYEKDSIYRDRWRQGDTVFVTVDKLQWSLGASVGIKFSKQFAMNKQAQKVAYNPNQTTADPEPANPGGGSNNEEIG